MRPLELTEHLHYNEEKKHRKQLIDLTSNNNVLLSQISSNQSNVHLNTDSLESLIGTDTSSSPLSLTALLRNQKDTIDNKLSQISSFLDKDNSQFHLKHHPDDHHVMLAGNTNSDGSGTKHHAHVDSNGVLHTTEIGAPQIRPHSTLEAENASQSVSLCATLLGRTDPNDRSTGKFIQVNSSGQINTAVVNSVNVELHGHTDISDTNSSVRLLSNSLGQLVVQESPTTYENVSLSNPTNALALSGSDTIDLNGFRNIFIAIRIVATSGGICNDIHLLGSNDNTTFVITSEKLTPTEARSVGVYEAGASFGSLGYRYLKLGSNNGVSGSGFSTTVSSMTIHTNRYNGSF